MNVDVEWYNAEHNVWEFHSRWHSGDLADRCAQRLADGFEGMARTFWWDDLRNAHVVVYRPRNMCKHPLEGLS